MQKKAGQISSNTLNLRFMKNAAKAQQDYELDAAKVKVRNEEEWELSSELWKDESQAQIDDKSVSVSYEQSYLPFLFPGFSNGSPSAHVPNTSNAGQESHIEGSEPRLYKGRRKFGKHGAEQQVSEPPPPPPEPSQKEIILPRGVRSISSRGRASASSSRLSQQSHPEQPRPGSTAKVEHASESAPSLNATPQVFMKPLVDAPKFQKRSSNDSQADGERKKKKRNKGP